MTTSEQCALSWISAIDKRHEYDHVVAFSGGVDSSLVAALVFKAFPHSSRAVLGVSSSLSATQHTLAHNIATQIGIPLEEVYTEEGTNEVYLENEGQACYACKTSLYTALNWEKILSVKMERTNDDKDILRKNDDFLAKKGKRKVLYNGTNADDVKDATRVGLKAAHEFDVISPLLSLGLTKDKVRALAKEIGLSNHDYAASPCLRSRLAYGVRATTDALKRVEQAEELVKKNLKNIINTSTNFRVRHLKSGGARIELDEHILEKQMAENELLLETLGTQIVAKLGYSHVVYGKYKPK